MTDAHKCVSATMSVQSVLDRAENDESEWQLGGSRRTSCRGSFDGARSFD